MIAFLVNIQNWVSKVQIKGVELDSNVPLKQYAHPRPTIRGY